MLSRPIIYALFWQFVVAFWGLHHQTPTGTLSLTPLEDFPPNPLICQPLEYILRATMLVLQIHPWWNYEDSISSFYLKLLRDREKVRKLDKRQIKHNLFGSDNGRHYITSLNTAKMECLSSYIWQHSFNSFTFYRNWKKQSHNEKLKGAVFLHWINSGWSLNKQYMYLLQSHDAACQKMLDTEDRVCEGTQNNVPQSSASDSANSSNSVQQWHHSNNTKNQCWLITRQCNVYFLL